MASAQVANSPGLAGGTPRTRKSILASMSPSSKNLRRSSINGNGDAANGDADHDAVDDDDADADAAAATAAAAPTTRRPSKGDYDYELNGAGLSRTDTLLKSRNKKSSKILSLRKNKSASAEPEDDAPAGRSIQRSNTTSSSKPNGTTNGPMGSLRRRLSNLSIGSDRSNNGGGGDDQSDRGSVHSNLSRHRDAISSFIRKSRRGSSADAEPSSGPTEEEVNRKSSFSGGSRRLGSLRSRTFSSSKKGGSASPDVEDVPPVPQRERTRSTTSSSRNSGEVTSLNSGGYRGSSTRRQRRASASAPAGYPAPADSDAEDQPGAAAAAAEQEDEVSEPEEEEEEEAQPEAPQTPSRSRRGSRKDATIVKSPKSPKSPKSRRGKRAQQAEGAEEEDEEMAPEAEESKSNGSSYGVPAGAGAAVGGGAAALTGLFAGKKDSSNGAHDDAEEEDESSDDEFHDADLADIDEGEEPEESEPDQKVAKSPASAKSDRRARRKSSGRKSEGRASDSAYSKAGRHRGVSEASGMQRQATQDHDDEDQGLGARSESPERYNEPTPQKQPQQQKSLSKLKGTAGAKRRAGSTPIPNQDGDDEKSNETPQDAKAKQDVPQDVKAKAAAVQKLGLDDVQQDDKDMRKDIETARGALHLFLNSRMIEAEDIIKEYADRKMYYALGYCLIATMKGFMTFESQDLAIAISYCKDSMHIAHLLRKPSNSVANFGRFVRGTGQSASSLAGMTIVQRHAELVYAESMLLKAVLGIVYSGDFFGFMSEALNMRNAYGIYRSLGKYVESADEKAGGFEQSIDEDFRSGVFLGNGLISMILGLLPSKVLKIMDVFGYTGDTKVGLETLMRAGGWEQNSKQKKPEISKKEEGIRRPVCDMGILLFHLVISVFIPVTGVDISFADRVLHYHLKRYPNGVFFLYFSGRLYSTQAMCEKAVKQYAQARDAQQEYVQLQHISWWDAALCHMSLAQYEQARQCFSVLLKESKWSTAVYSYGVAANMLQSDQGNKGEAKRLMASVPGSRQKIAGKSIPMEKYVARKAEKFNKQGRLLLPALEFSYIYHCFSNAPRYALMDEQLVMISDALGELNEVEDPGQYHSGASEYWDDFCLAHFLRGVTLKYIAHPEPHVRPDPPKSDIPQSEAEEQAMLSFDAVLSNGHKMGSDAYLIYFAHYERGRLFANRGDYGSARKEFDLILAGKRLEDKDIPRDGKKYSMENMCLLRSNAALNNLPK